MWERKIDGKTLTFHLAGINNENFIMRDDETGSWWQQVTGEAIYGPMKGRRLKQVFQEEVSFATWRNEHPLGRVLRPDKRFERGYEGDTEQDIAKLPVVTPAAKGEPLPPRTIVIGIELNGQSRAYQRSDLDQKGVTLDTLGGVPIAIIPDVGGKGARAYERLVNGSEVELFAKPDSSPTVLVDPASNSEWSSAGVATSGPMTGRKLKPVPVLSDYWFDWKTYHPKTSVFSPPALPEGK